MFKLRLVSLLAGTLLYLLGVSGQPFPVEKIAVVGLENKGCSGLDRAGLVEYSGMFSNVLLNTPKLLTILVKHCLWFVAVRATGELLIWNGDFKCVWNGF
ncbi:unnamed protein product [Colias eurytheme]|nr:unnamed protein product [Colias eurytheme]